MLRVLFLMIFVALSFLGVANTVRARQEAGASKGTDSFPALDMHAACRDVAKNELNKTTDFPGCISNERTAREQLQKEWASYSTDMQGQCLHLVTPPALPSYVTLQQCLTMSRDARNLMKTDGATDIGKTMQAPSGK